MSGVTIAGVGHYVPSRRVPNAVIEARLGLENGWIVRRTGIEARRYVADDEALSDIAVNAGRMALDDSGLAAGDIGLVLLATSTPDHLLPPSAPLVAHRLGLTRSGGIDMAGACGGFIYALTLADSYVRAHHVAVLVIAANVLSRRINQHDRASSVLFSDAAGAVVLTPSSRSGTGVIGAKLASSGDHYGLIQIHGGGSRRPFSSISDVSDTLMVISNGQAVYAQAVEMMTSTARSALQSASIAAADITHFVPHQANARMIKTVARQLSIGNDRVLTTISEFANSSAATIPVTLSACRDAHPLRRGSDLLLTAAGAGMTGGAVVFRI